MATPPDEREVEEGVRHFIAILEHTLEQVRANRLTTARFSLSPSTALRVLVGVPAEHLRMTVGMIGRMQAHLSEDGTGAADAKRELEQLLAFWKDGWRGGRVE